MAERDIDTPRRFRPARNVLPTIALVTAIAYILLLILPLLGSGLNPLTAHPEDYAAGPLGLAVNVSYLALAVALGTLTASLLPVRGWSVAVPVLVAPVAVVCLALAVDPIGFVRGNDWLFIPILGLALAPTVTALTLRDRFGAWTRDVAAAGAAALIAFAVLAVAPDSVGGLVNRVFDFLVGLWIVVAAVALRHRVSV